MGAALTYLSSSAVTTVKSESAEWTSSDVTATAGSMQGWRRGMEDAHFMTHHKEKNVYLFGVFDGHGGAGVSRYCAQKVPEKIFSNPHFASGEYDIALHESFMEIDRECMEQENQDEIYRLHMEQANGVSETDMKKIEMTISAETLMDLFLGHPNDPADHPPDPFRVFLDNYSVPEVSVLEEAMSGGSVPSSPNSSRKRKRGRTQVGPTNEPDSPWGGMAAELRAEGSVTSEFVAKFKSIIATLEESYFSPTSLMELKLDMQWGAETVSDMLFTNPIEFLFSGPLVKLLRPVAGPVPWVYSIHPTELMAALNNDYRTLDTNTRCVSEDQGCTANVVLVAMDTGTVYCANSGDSRAVLIRDSSAQKFIGIPLSVDHKPSLASERRRVLYAGGRVIGKEDPRVQGDLNLSRAIGDWRHKKNPDVPLELQMISPRPDIAIRKLERVDRFIVLACDGIWERFTSASIAEYIREQSTKHALSKLCGEMCLRVVRKSDEFPGIPVGVTVGCDNMSAVLVEFGKEVREKWPEPSGEAMPAKLRFVSYGPQVPEDWHPPKRTPKNTPQRG
jgi:serine/threonine protein phosphatase PrpC